MNSDVIFVFPRLILVMPHISGCQFCGVSCNSLQGHHNFWNERAIPLFCPPNCTLIPNSTLPPLYHSPTSMGPTNPILPHNTYYPYNIFPPGMDLGVANYKVPFLPPSENFSDKRRNMKNNGIESKNQFEIDIEKVMCGDDSRTTLMIKNIPNRYAYSIIMVYFFKRITPFYPCKLFFCTLAKSYL
jgi:hypothetical protein